MSKSLRVFIIIALLFVFQSNKALAGYKNSAKLVLINKITTKITEIEVARNNIFIHDNIEIKHIKCWDSNSFLEPENKALLKVSEIVSEDENKTLFSGWMFSSSPSISTLEHSVYSLTLKDCF